jgi:hypothetical protein
MLRSVRAVLGHGRGEGFVSFRKISDLLCAQISLLFSWYQVNRLGREHVRSPSSSADVTNIWNCTSIPKYAVMA